MKIQSGKPGGQYQMIAGNNSKIQQIYGGRLISAQRPTAGVQMGFGAIDGEV